MGSLNNKVVEFTMSKIKVAEEKINSCEYILYIEKIYNPYFHKGFGNLTYSLQYKM